MEQVHKPLSNMEPVSATSVSYQLQANQEPLSTFHPNNQLNEQPLTKVGFTLTELANVTIQVAGVIFAGVFGVWAVKSYESANVANRLAQEALQQSLNANILAIINLCLSDQFSGFIDCSAMLQEAPFASVVHGVMPTLSISIRPTRSAVSLRQPRPSSLFSPPVSSIPASSPPPSPTTTPSQSTSPDSTQSPSPIPTTPAPTSTLTNSTTTFVRPGADSPPSEIAFGTVIAIIIAVVVTVAICCLVLIRHRRTKRSRF